MRTYTGLAVLAVGWLAADAGTASAAWNNVFQSCCHSCRPQTSYYAPAPACPAPCPTISYRQRCYYCPYTAYRQENYCEPVTSYQTSYYWSPVTSYRYTTYYDPCTGCPQQVAQACTSYVLRSQCNAVQSYVQRCRMVPYTAYRQSCYMEPVVTYSAPACPTCPTGGVAPGVAEPSTSQPPISQPPVGGVDPDRKPLPGVSEGPDRLPPQNIQNRYRAPAPATDTPLRMDRISSNQGRLQGMVVASDRITPLGGARIVFTSVSRQGAQFSAQADPSGRFSIELPPGEWDLLMTSNRDAKPVPHSTIQVRNNDYRVVTVVSR
jgi:hypothetical protein